MTEALRQLPAAVEDEDVAFVADARLLSILGEQLIGSEKVGVLELVKNAYDAAAAKCTVTLEGVPGLDPSTRLLTEYSGLPGPIIEIRDDGKGMAQRDLVHGWLRPATSRRARVKDALRAAREEAEKRGSTNEFEALAARLREEHGGRLPLGEKGIGRLATHRLGRYLWLRTKTADDAREWELKIEWDRFDGLADDPVDLSAVKLILRHQPASADYGSRDSGTIICCYGGRSGYQWDIDSITDLGRAISALRSPTRAPRAFEPRFVSPHVPDAALASPLERLPAPFELTAIVDELGQADIEFLFRPPASLDPPLPPITEIEKADLRSKHAKAWSLPSKTALRHPTCGPFIVHIRAWLRSSKWMGPDYKELTEYLNHFGGLTVYRDGLAALPAQQTAKGDWLGLAQAQIKKSSNISYYHLAGEVELAQERTLDLRDRSSREGMIETSPYRDLVLLTKAVVDELQLRMQKVRAAYTRLTRAARLSSAAIRSDAQLAAVVLQQIAERYDFTADELQISKAASKADAPQGLRDLADRLQQLVDQLALLSDEREGLLEAAGFGIAIGVAVHEIARLATAIQADARRLEGFLEGRAESVRRHLQQHAEALLSEVKRLAPLRVTRAELPRAVSIRGAIEAARNAFIASLRETDVAIRVQGGDFGITARFGSISQVFANLLDNALYWIETQQRPGVVEITIFPEDRKVRFSDSGPGISLKMAQHLFEPFFSDKSPPSGLGLYICRHYLASCGAAIRSASLSERSALEGAQFILDFSAAPAAELT